MFTGVLDRFFSLQILHGDELLQEYREQIEREEDIEAGRGTIYDRNGIPLAYNELSYSTTIVDDDFYDTTKKYNKTLNQDISDTISLLERYGDHVENMLPITKMDEQIARCMVIHQMLGTRISDTLTLRKDCLYKENNQDMIRIKQVKTSDFCKPISEELAELIRQAILYDKKLKNDSKYIFVNEENLKRPMQYTTIKHKILRMILKEDLRDD